MAYPSTIDAPVGTAVAGTSKLASPDHSTDHHILGLGLVAVENTLGTTAGTSIAKNFAQGDFAARINSSNVMQQNIAGGTFNNVVLGTSQFTGGTISTAVHAGGTVTGQIVNSGTIANGIYGTALYQGGTANGLTLGTPTIGTITVPGTVNALSFSAAIAPGVGTITDSAGGTLTVNAQAAQIFYCALGTTAGNRTVAAPLNPTPYQQLSFAFKTSGSANGTLVWNSAFRFSQDAGTATLGTGVGWNYFAFRYNNIDTKWDAQGASRNLI